MYKFIRYLLTKFGVQHSKVKNEELSVVSILRFVPVDLWITSFFVLQTPPPESRIDLEEIDEDVQAEGMTISEGAGSNGSL